MNRRRPELWRCALLGALLAAVVSGCGGSGGVDSGGTGIEPPTLAVGPISGFGSIVVAGVHFDETAAELTDGDGRVLPAAALTLGAVVRIDASAISDNGTRREAQARTVRVDEAVIGPVEAVDVAAGTARVLGQAVAVNAGTVFDARLAGGVTGLVPGRVVAVHGLLDSAGRRIVATRIEPRDGAARYVVRGALVVLDRNAGRLTVGTLQASTADPSSLPATLAPGRTARLTLQTTAVAGVWPAVAVRDDDAPLPDRSHAEVEGRVTALASTARFTVAGVPVDATAADVVGSVRLDARVEVEGSLSGGVLLARSVKVDDDDGAGDEAIELEGTISNADAAARSFVVRGVTVLWNEATRFDSSTPADIRDNRRVAVKGRLAADRSRVEATLVHVEL